MFPSTLSTFNIVNPTDRLNSPSHSALHNTVSSSLGQLETVVGLRGDSSVLGTINTAVFSPGSEGGGHIQGAAFGGTGQTSFTKGDILVAQSASVLSKLAVSTDGAVLTADSSAATGIKWGAGVNPTINSYVGPSVFTWIKPSSLSYVIIELAGGGGGGGGSEDTGVRSRAGGGGGGYSFKKISANLITPSVLVRVGNGGAGGPGGAGSDTIGQSGSITSFGIFASCAGGIGGGDTGGAGGSAEGGLFNIIGQTGDGGGTVSVNIGARGGSTPLGMGGAAVILGSEGLPGTGYGSGGSGSYKSAANGTGGNGANGIITIYEY